MGVGKYSPTVSSAYGKNEDWFENYSKGEWYDPEGFDSYGYDKDGYDRADNHEDDYIIGEWDGDEYGYPRYEMVLDDYGIDENGLPKYLG